MKRLPTKPQLAAAGVRPGASQSHEYHLAPPPAGELGDLKTATAQAMPRDALEEQALHQWQNALRTLRRTLSGRRR